MPVILGGPTAQRTRVTGDIVSCYQYVNGERSLVLYPKRKRGLNVGAFVVGDSAAWKYTDPRYLMEQSIKAAEVMGMDTTRSTAMRIADVIIDGLEDLVRMMPETAEEEALNKAIAGEVKLPIESAEFSIDGQKVSLQ